MSCTERFAGSPCPFTPVTGGKCGYHGQPDSDDTVDRDAWNATLRLPEPERSEAQRKLLKNS